jgi:uncharacterized phiE125 gp8 family phage protein
MQMNYVLGQPIFSDENDTEPVLLAEMKTYLRISSDETFNDTLITQLIKTARQQLETYLNISLISKTITARLQNDSGYMLLPYSAPEITISSVKDDEDNDISSDSYSLKGNLFTANASTNAWPGNNFFSPCNSIVNVVYAVDYSDDGLPVHFKTAIMQQVSWLYERRGDEIETALSPLVKLSMKPYRQVA